MNSQIGSSACELIDQCRYKERAILTASLLMGISTNSQKGKGNGKKNRKTRKELNQERDKKIEQEAAEEKIRNARQYEENEKKAAEEKIRNAELYEEYKEELKTIEAQFDQDEILEKIKRDNSHPNQVRYQIQLLEAIEKLEFVIDYRYHIIYAQVEEFHDIMNKDVSCYDFKKNFDDIDKPPKLRRELKYKKMGKQGSPIQSIKETNKCFYKKYELLLVRKDMRDWQISQIDIVIEDWKEYWAKFLLLYKRINWYQHLVTIDDDRILSLLRREKDKDRKIFILQKDFLMKETDKEIEKLLDILSQFNERSIETSLSAK